MRCFWTLSLLFLLPILASALPDRAQCNHKDLQRQDCRLQKKPWEFQLSNKTIAWQDGTWSTVDPMPITGENLTWEKALLHPMSKRMLIELWIWGPSVGEGQVQSLNWYVVELQHNQKMTQVLHRVVRKRHPEAKENAKPKFVYDAMDKHGLKLKGQKVEWHHLGERGHF